MTTTTIKPNNHFRGRRPLRPGRHVHQLLLHVVERGALREQPAYLRSYSSPGVLATGKTAANGCASGATPSNANVYVYVYVYVYV